MYSQHANGGGNGVADGDSDDVRVLQEPAELDLDATCSTKRPTGEGETTRVSSCSATCQQRQTAKNGMRACVRARGVFFARTEVGVNRVHVGVVALAGAGVAGAVAVGEQRRRVVGDEGEEQHDGGAGHPAELRDGPRQRQHAGTYHGGDNVRARRPHRAFMTDHAEHQVFFLHLSESDEEEARQAGVACIASWLLVCRRRPLALLTGALEATVVVIALRGRRVTKLYGALLHGRRVAVLPHLCTGYKYNTRTVRRLQLAKAHREKESWIIVGRQSQR